MRFCKRRSCVCMCSTDPLSPLCARYTFTDAGYAALFCADAAVVIEAALTAVGGASATGTAAVGGSVTEKFPVATAAAVTTTAEQLSGGRTSDAGASATGARGGGGVGAGNPFTKTQGSVAGGTGAAASATVVRGNGCGRGGRGRVGFGGVLAMVIVGCLGVVA